ncbi:MAG: hypothetical protein E7531_04920 [Ruminococcaceae bacterium]|nr:hypothetical protein [Oscillospiraceae bacterium]
MKKLFIIFLAIFMVVIIAACFIKEEIFITSQTSPDGNYVVSLYQVGSPQWPFGSVDARLVLENANGKKVDKVKFSLANDGAGVFEGNIEKITWKKNQVEIIMGEADTTNQFTYVLMYTD